MKYSIQQIAEIVNDPRAGVRVFAIETQTDQRDAVMVALSGLLTDHEAVPLNEDAVSRAREIPAIINYCDRTPVYGSPHFISDALIDIPSIKHNLMLAILEKQITNGVLVFERDQNGNIPIPLPLLNRMVWLEAEAM